MKEETNDGISHTSPKQKRDEGGEAKITHILRHILLPVFQASEINPK